MPQRDTSQASGLSEIARGQVKRLARCLDQVMADGDVEGVHDLRVATRRLRESLSMGSTGTTPRTVRGARRKLRKLRDAFAHVRDLDVVQTILNDAVQADRLRPDESARLEGTLTRLRQRSIDKARRRVRKNRLTRVVSDVRNLSDLLERVAPRPGDDTAVALQQRFTRRAEAVIRVGPPAASDSDLHVLRLAVKKVRYCAEILQRAGVRQDDGLITELVALQDLLGHWNDLVMAARILARVATRWREIAHAPAWSARLLQFSAVQAHAAEAERDKIVNRWPSFEPVLRRALESAVPSESTPTESAPAAH